MFYEGRWLGFDFATIKMNSADAFLDLIPTRIIDLFVPVVQMSISKPEVQGHDSL